MFPNLNVGFYSNGKGVRALRGYFDLPMRSKNKSCSSQVSLYKFIRTIAEV